MSPAFANASFGMVGLAIFLLFFAGVLLWVFMPGSKQKFNQYSKIPLKDEDNE